MNTKYTCGGCTACCTTHGVRAIEKPPHVECLHCQRGCGCSIYGSRPSECRSFACSWIVGDFGGGDCRPDRTGFVPLYELIAGTRIIVLVLTEYRRGALDSEYIFRVTRQNLSLDIFTVHIPIEGNIRFYLPAGAELPTPQERVTLEELWERKVDAILFESSLRGLVL